MEIAQRYHQLNVVTESVQNLTENKF